MVKLPDVLGLVLCDEFQVDAVARRVSLMGLFLSLRFTAFPARCRPFAVYAALFDARGEGEMRLICTRLETEEDLYYNSWWCSFPSAGRTTHLPMRIPGIEFPAPGRYRLTLSFDQKTISTRFFDVVRV